jgi:dihydrodipicolinate synthase/N-acetylneuraminate lyase
LLKAGDVAAAEALRTKFIAFEDQRDARSPIVVLHDAVRLAGITDTGPLQPYLANLDEDGIAAVAPAAKALYDENARFAERRAA